MIWITLIIIALIVLTYLFLMNTLKMKRIQAEVRDAYLEEGLTYDEASKVAWYLIDVFIYMRNNKDPKLAKVVMNSTIAVFKHRLYKNDAYEGHFSARKQVEGIRDACLLINKPVAETAELIYSSVVASYKKHLEQKAR